MRKWKETDFQFLDSFVRLSSGELCLFLVSVGEGEVLIQHLGYLICFLTLSEPPNRVFAFMCEVVVILKMGMAFCSQKLTGMFT